MNVVKWASQQAGRYVTAPGGLGGQCVDLANLYLLSRHTPLVRRNAVDWAKPGALPAGWVWVDNAPMNAPALGDLVVWRANVAAHAIGPYGHIAVALAGDTSALLTLDQDWPGGAPVGAVWHDYLGVLGWWAPLAG